MTHEEVAEKLRAYRDRRTGAGVLIDYTNHRGERATRAVLPAVASLRRLAGDDPEARWHRPGEWVFDGYDLDKGADRTFSCEGVHGWELVT